MTLALILILTVACVAVVFFYLTRRGGFVQLPFFAGAILLGWLVPQLFAYYREAPAEHELLQPLVIVALLAFIATIAGWVLGYSSKTQRLLHLERVGKSVSFTKISPHTSLSVKPLIALTAFGLAITLAILSLPADMLTSRMPTGIVTVLRFFSNTRAISLTLAVILYLYRPSGFAAALIAVNAMLYAPSILIQIKRNDIIECAVIALACLWFIRRRTVSPYIIVAGATAALILVSSVTQLRQISGFERNAVGDVEVNLPTLGEVSEIDFIDGAAVALESKYVEARNAANYIDYIKRNRIWSYGAQAWNRIINLYVPSQFVGSDTKQRLFLGYDLYDFEFSEGFYSRPPGSTLTGFLQGFADFGYFGCLVYFIIAYFLGGLFARAMRGSLFSQIAYITLIIPMITSFTHDTYLVLTQSIFYLPLCWIMVKTTVGSSVPKRPHQPNRARAPV